MALSSSLIPPALTQNPNLTYTHNRFLRKNIHPLQNPNLSLHRSNPNPPRANPKLRLSLSSTFSHVSQTLHSNSIKTKRNCISNFCMAATQGGSGSESPKRDFISSLAVGCSGLAKWCWTSMLKFWLVGLVLLPLGAFLLRFSTNGFQILVVLTGLLLPLGIFLMPILLFLGVVFVYFWVLWVVVLFSLLLLLWVLLTLFYM